MKKDKGWWDEFFPAFRPLFGILPQRMTNAEVRFILSMMNLKPGSKFLDCPCGIGIVPEVYRQQRTLLKTLALGKSPQSCFQGINQ